ncbi:MAG: restriction endonuclease subunit S [Eubacteriales bacterium]|nr:restriction endonuclease subunit S [Eubacteriales bacterium]
MMRKMKDSGVEWIGEIPADWKICRFKNVAELYTGNSIKDEEKEQYEDIVDARPYIATKDIDITFGNVNYTNGLFVKLDDSSFKVAPRNSTLMCIEGGSAGRKKAKLSKDVAFVNKLCCFFSNKVDNAFLYYFLCSPNYEKEFNNNLSGLIGGVSVSVLKNISFLMPPLEQQHRIADYLDGKCAKIDDIIAKEQAIIEKLKGYKLSLITETVTKGLNPDVPMKDSGTDICSKIPENWAVSRIKYLFQLRDEKNNLPLEEVKLLSLYTEFGVFPHGEQDERGNKAVTADGYKVVYEKDIVVNIILAWMGAIGVSNYDGVTSPAYDIYKPLKNVNSVFYHYLFRTKAFSAECYKYGRGIMAMRWRTYSTEFKNIFVPVPPAEEQQQIVDYLNGKCEKIDLAITNKQAVINKLTEYKKSLIYEVVTGKKEV